jgi:transposase
LLGLLAMLNQQVDKLDAAVQQAAEENPQARLLMTQPGVGPNTALAFCADHRRCNSISPG